MLSFQARVFVKKSWKKCRIKCWALGVLAFGATGRGYVFLFDYLQKEKEDFQSLSLLLLLSRTISYRSS